MDIKVRFTYGGLDPYLDIVKFQSILKKVCLKILFLLSALLIIIQISVKSHHLAQKC